MKRQRNQNLDIQHARLRACSHLFIFIFFFVLSFCLFMHENAKIKIKKKSFHIYIYIETIEWRDLKLSSTYSYSDSLCVHLNVCCVRVVVRQAATIQTSERKIIINS